MNCELQSVQYAYVDESGDTNLALEKSGVSRFYVVTAILTDAARNADLIAKVETVRRQFFGEGEMKSSGVGKDTQRRRLILSALAGTGLKFCAIVADKKQIDPGSGLQYKKSFIKYLHGRLYKRLYRAFSSLHVLADEHGHPEFMQGFKEYLENRYQKELFDHEDFAFVSSVDHPLIQAADLIGGSIFRVYSERDAPSLLDVLSESAIIVERWPPATGRADLVAGLSDQDRFDHLVSQQGVMLAREFVESHSSADDPDTESQVEALRYLLYRYELDPTEYVHAEPIRNHVNQSRDEEITIQAFRTNVIGKLRSDGVIIASSNRGYKIPNTTSDIADFVALVEGLAVPYIRRLAQARSHLLLASQGQYDIVPADRHLQLAACLSAIDGGGFEDFPAAPPTPDH